MFTHNNFGQVIQIDAYHTSVAAGNLTGRVKRHLDILGQEYKRETYAVDPATGTVGAVTGETPQVDFFVALVCSPYRTRSSRNG